MYSFANKTPFTPSVILCRIQYFKMIVFMRSRNLQRRLECRDCPFDQRGRFTVSKIHWNAFAVENKCFTISAASIAFFSLVLIRRTITAGRLEAH